jgi:hypothetical protein
MRISRAVLIGTVLFASVSALAQEEKVNVFGAYSYFRYNPTINGLSSRSFEGGGGGATFYFPKLKLVGIKADLMTYGNTSFSQTYLTPIVVPGRGVIPAGTYTGQANLFTYLFGPVVHIPVHGVRPFGEILFGGSYTNIYANLVRSINGNGGTLPTPSQHPFTMAVGGGLDVSTSRRVSLRVAELDYVLTRYTNPLTSTNNQNNFRFLAGVVFKF